MEWFKMQTAWGEAVDMLTDEEAGRVLKGIYAYMLTGEIRKGDGREDIFMAILMKTLQREVEKYETGIAEETKKKEKRKQRAVHAAEVRWNRQDEENPEASGDVEACGGHKRACTEQNEHHRACTKNKEYKNTEVRMTEERKKRYTEAEGDIPFCSELPPEASELPVVEIPLNDGSEYPLYRRDVDEYISLYPAVEIEQELRNIRGWCLSNPARRKTQRGIRRFINGWLSRAQDRGGGGRKPEIPENPFLKYATGEAEIGEYLL